jgi:hypothetical protein
MREIAMIGSRRVLAAFLLLLAVFGATHVLNYPGSVAHFKTATGGHRIFDMQASVSADETYQRLQSMGEGGRELYLRLIFTVDVVFPVAMLIFLLVLTRFAAERARMNSLPRAMLVAVPLVYFGLDLLENASALAMLLCFPGRLDWLGGTIGYLTKGKRAFMVLAFVVPHLVIVLASVRARWRGRKAQPASVAA